jgi:hypothetical protein
MQKFILKFIPVVSLLALTPLVAHAQFFDRCYGIVGLSYMLCKVSGLLNSAIPVLVALGVVYTVWGIVRYFIGDSEEAKTKGKDSIIYGIIGLAVIVGLWGLVVLVLDTFGAPDKYAAPSSYDLDKLLPRSKN